jgi:uncharacterized protein (TIGR02246 family)
MNQHLQTLRSTAADEAAIRALYQQLMDGWNAASGDAFAAPFEEDGDLVGFDGTHIKGRQEIALFHQHLFDMFLKGSRLVGKVTSQRFLTSDVAVVHTVGGTVMGKLILSQSEIRSRHLLLSSATASGVLLRSRIRGRHISAGRRNLGK